ncbi:MAG: putative zinc-binding metallopeptidase [Deltaproteobacteria bacterium]|nr:putative zinc-binding metallopeptidase [Deltaproteobacteria bacterium]
MACHIGASSTTGCATQASDAASPTDLEQAPAEVRDLLRTRISQLGLRLEGSPVERCIEQLYRELARKGLQRFRPICYLSDEWGCPSGAPVIGIPFYLADPRLARLEREVNDLEDEREILSYLRHEAGHAINYAYRFYREPLWRRLFGPFNRPYRDRYRPVPFSREFVRHLPGWYAQKHPDEDFAETFAVWLAPRSNWRRRYRDWPAMRKLRYVERTARRITDQDPIVRKGDFDVTVDNMHLTLAEFYARGLEETRAVETIAIDADLEQIFFRKGRRRTALKPAAEIIEQHRVALTDTLAYWTGAHRPLVRRLLRRMARRARELDLFGTQGHEAEYLVPLTAFGTTLAMHSVTNGGFEHGAH